MCQRTAVVRRKLCAKQGRTTGTGDVLLHSSNYSCVDSLKLSLPPGVKRGKFLKQSVSRPRKVFFHQTSVKNEQKWHVSRLKFSGASPCWQMMHAFLGIWVATLVTWVWREETSAQHLQLLLAMMATPEKSNSKLCSPCVGGCLGSMYSTESLARRQINRRVDLLWRCTKPTKRTVLQLLSEYKICSHGSTEWSIFFLCHLRVRDVHTEALN